jgi:protein-tyrosine phosphatase
MQARNIAFICSGNVIRSPFAAQYCLLLASLAGVPLDVRSAGTRPIVRPDPVPPFACAAADRWGVDLSTHRSAAATRALVKWADVVLVMDSSHLAFLRQRCPEEMRKVFYLAAALPEPGEMLDISDPNSAPDMCPAVYRQIADAVHALLGLMGRTNEVPPHVGGQKWL